ncbi:MAG: DUF1475 domain-containing protein [Ignavibacteria bacterium]|nr:DUF1475 domain-containing protein [Ignavibacteria bacterium]
MNKNQLLIVFSILWFYIVYTVITTSMQSNLFTEWNYLASIPWMRATLVDFYINVVAIFTWIALRERSKLALTFWLLGLVFLGSIATTTYIIVQLIKLKAGEPVSNAFSPLAYRRR